MFSLSGKIFIKLTFEASFALDKFSRIFTKLFFAGENSEILLKIRENC